MHCHDAHRSRGSRAVGSRGCTALPDAGRPELVRICSACGGENPERFRLCGYCGAPLSTPAVGRRKLATLLFCDLSGSTAMGERVDAEAVRELMVSYFEEARGA